MAAKKQKKRSKKKKEAEVIPLENLGSPETLYMAGVIDIEDIEIMKFEQEAAEDDTKWERPKWNDEDPELEEHPWLGVKSEEELLDLAEKEGWDESDSMDNLHAFSEWEENQMPTTRQIEEENWAMRKRWRDFRTAANWVRNTLSRLPAVQKVALIGSVALPLQKEVPRFRKFRRNRVAIWHECKDVDLAVWLDDLSDLNGFRKTVGKSLRELGRTMEVHVANHQMELFILEPDTDRYLGKLCDFNECPKGKRDCLAPDCGTPPFLKQYEDFKFYPNSTAPDKCQMLFERRGENNRNSSNYDLPF